MAPRVWLITGCSSGFGNELTRQVLKRGDKVIATARNVAKIASFKEAGADILTLDVSADYDVVQKAIHNAQAIHGRLDIVVNNAGFVQEGAFEELNSEEVFASFNTNVFGVLKVVRAVVPYMREQKSGIIANFSSIAAWTGTPGVGLYCATKFALSGASEALTAELAPFGIKVVSIESGYFRSNLLNTGNRIIAKNMAEYDGTPVRQYSELLEKVNNKQPGDVVKGCSVIIDVLTQTGAASGRDIPLRLPLGPDAIEAIKGKCRDTLTLLDDWKAVVSTTNHDDVK